MIAGQIEIQLMADIARIRADMDRANQIVGDATSRMGRAAGVAKMAIGAIAGAMSVGAFAGWIKGAIDAADASSKLSAKTGVAVKYIAGLQLAFDLGGAGGDAFSNSMVKLSKAIVGGNDGLKALGIRTQGANGQLLENKQVLYSVADAFAKMDDGARKTAMAVEIFGKSGADLIPLLNGGAEGFRQMDEMARKLGLTISESTAKSAEAFNDNLDLLAMGSQGVARGIAAELLPTLSSLSGSFLESMTSGDRLKSTADFLATGLKMLYTVAVGIVEVFSTVGKTIGAAGGQIVAILTGDFKLAAKIGDEWSKDIGDSWAGTAKTISDAWSGAGSDTVNEMAKMRKGGKDLLAEQAARDAAKKKSASEYASSLKSANEFIEAMKIEASQIGMTADQIKMMSAARAAAKAPLAAQGKQIMELALANEIAAKAVTAKADADKLAVSAQSDSDAGIASINAETAALMLRIKTHGMLPEAITRAAIAELEASKQSLALTDAGIADIQRRIEALKGLAAAQAGSTALESGTSLAKAKELLDVLVAVDNATKSAAAGMAESFGRVGSAIGGLTTALSGYAVQQQAIAAQMAAARENPKNSPAALAKMEIAAANASKQAKIKSYGDMASAAKGFFKENSTGYKVMEGAEKAFRAFEMAMQLKSLALSLFATGAKTTAVIGGQAAETTAVGTGEAARNLLKIPGVIMSFMSSMGPWGAAAAGVAIAAVLGSAGGSKGGPSAADRQASQGTGSVLGDSSAKSESIAKAIALSANNSNIELVHTAGMLRALLSIESNIGNLGGVLTRSGAVTGAVPGDTMGTMSSLATKLDAVGLFGKFTSKITNAIFGGNTTTLDGGITAQKGALGSILASGIKASSYVDTKKDGGLFRSDKYSTQTSALGAEANDQFTKVLASMAAGIKEAGKLLGFGGDAFTAKLNSFVVDLGKISTKGLSATQIQEQLEAVFSKAADEMARFSVAGLMEFQKQGEGAFETLVRVASNYANLDSILESVGMSFGAVGMQSLAAREDLIELAGGIDQLASQTASFANNYLTEAERLAPVAKYVADEMAALGLASIDTREEFKKHVLGLKLAGKAEGEQYVALMALESAFAKVHAATVDLTKSQQAIADERADLQNRLDELTMTSAGLLDKQRRALDSSNRGLFDQIQGITALRAAQEASKTSLSDMIGKMKSFGDSARTLRDGLMMGSLSTLTPEQQYAEARRQRDATRAAALGGDTVAQSNLSAMQTAFLTISQKINGGDAQYSADFAGVVQMSDEIAKLSAGQIDVAQASLDALNKQVIGIADLNLSMLDVVRAVEQLPTALVTAPQMPNYSAMGTVSMEPLVAEIKALRQEVVTLRAEQKVQTGDLITSGARTAAKSDTAIVEGVAAAVKPRATASNSTAALA